MRVKPFLLSFFLIFVSISLLLSIWFIILLLSDLAETLYGDATLLAFTSSLTFLVRFSSFACASLQFACQIENDCSKIVPDKEVIRGSAYQIYST
jgi:hypothetical protein